MTQTRRALPLVRVLLATASLGLATPLCLHALWEAADGEVFLSLNASIAADSNIGSSAAEVSDTIYTVTPGFSWERSRGRGSISLGAQYAIERAAEYDGFDSENLSANFSIEMDATPSGRLSGGFSAGYFDGSRVGRFENTRLSQRSYDFALNGSYEVTAKLNSRLNASYDETRPEDLPDYDRSSLRLGLGYNIRPLISTFVDVRFTESSSSRSAGELGARGDTSGKAVMFGIDGEITPRLHGSIGIGYDWSESELATGDTEYSGIAYDVSLDWQPRERTSFSLTASNGIRAASLGAIEYVSVEFAADQEIGLNMSANASLGFRSNDYESSLRGDDDVVEATLGFTYAFTRNISVGASYAYTDSDSSNAVFSYSRSVWSLFGNVRY